MCVSIYFHFLCVGIRFFNVFYAFSRLRLFFIVFVFLWNLGCIEQLYKKSADTLETPQICENDMHTHENAEKTTGNRVEPPEIPENPVESKRIRKNQKESIFNT